MDRVLIIGCGYTGRRIALLEQARGHAVTGVVRHADSAERLRGLGIHAEARDLDSGELPIWRAERVYHCAPPPREGDDDPRLARVLERLEGVRRLVYLGTTGVYGDRGGAVVSEADPTAPGTARARRRLAAEQRVREWARHAGTEQVILRVAAIYGPGRLPLERLRAGEAVPDDAEAGPGNRIHVDDLAAAAVAAMAAAPAGALFNVSDGNPLPAGAFADAVADAAGLPRPPRIGRREAEQRFSAMRREFLRESRRVDNTRLLALPGFRLRYPDPREGIRDSLQAQDREAE